LLSSVQLGVFRPSLFEDGDVLVGIFPEGKEILIGVFGLGPVARGNICSAQLQVGQGAYRIGENDAAVIQDFLKFHSGLLPTTSCKVRLPPDIRGVEATEFGKERRARQREIVRTRPFQMLDRVQRRPMGECGKRAQRGKILELHRSILREPFLQVYGKPLRGGGLARERQRECGGILHIAPFCEIERGRSVLLGLSRIPKMRFAHGSRAL
jgi:hypothetical protein